MRNALLAFAFVALSARAAVPTPKAPPGFRVEVFAEKVDGARSLALSPGGWLFVGTRDDRVYAIDTNAKERLVRVVAKGLEKPNGVAVKDGNLYVAEISRIRVFENIEAQLKGTEFRSSVLTDKYPTDGHHGWKFIRFGPDGGLYVPVGAPCNVCERPDPYASITRFDLKTKTFRVVARGVRNTVGFDWDANGKLWFTENGRDLMGDDVPPCEINRLDKEGAHFGFPACHGANVSDPRYGPRGKCADFVAPRYELQAHSAPLGLRFYRGSSFPEKYRKGAFFAEHGSWNRSKKVGYRVQFFSENSKPEVFLDGFLSGEKTLGRPVDVEFLSDGSMLVSDDYGDRIWRVRHAP